MEATTAHRNGETVTELHVGRLTFTNIFSEGPRCGIHGDPTGTGRCATCDSEAAAR